MKLRSMVVVISAALIGATTPGLAQAARGDGYRDGGHRGNHSGYSGHNRGGDRGYHRGHDRGHDRGGSGLGMALGLGILGLAIASQYNANAVPQPYNPPVYQQPAYGYSYGPGYSYGSSYYQPGYAPYGYSQPGYPAY